MKKAWCLLLLLCQALCKEALLSEEESRKGLDNEVDKYFGEKLKQSAHFTSLVNKLKDIDAEQKGQREQLNRQEDSTIGDIQKVRQVQALVARETEQAEQTRNVLSALPKVNYFSIVQQLLNKIEYLAKENDQKEFANKSL